MSDRLERATFDPAELARVELAEHLAVLPSGGPIMNVECTEGGRAACSWTDEDGRRRAALIPTACLRSLVPFVEPDDAPTSSGKDCGP